MSQARQRAIVVLGPGRCGTSTIARGLIALGIDFGNRLKPATRKNPRGFFEDLDLLSVNYEVHARLGLRRNGSSVSWIADDTWRQADLAPLQARARQVIRRRFDGAAVWGCKVGGMMRILPFWRQVFEAEDQNVAYVLAIRHPASVARSRAKLDPYRAIPEKSDLEFAAQILPFAAEVFRRPTLVVDYDQVIADPRRQLRRIAGQLGLPVTPAVAAGIDAYAGAFVSASLRHAHGGGQEGEHGGEQGGAALPLTARLYRRLQSLATDDAAPDDPAVRQDLADLTAEFRAMTPMLRLVDELEDRLRRRGPSLRSLLLTAYSHLPTPATFSGLFVPTGTGAARQRDATRP